MLVSLSSRRSSGELSCSPRKTGALGVAVGNVQRRRLRVRPRGHAGPQLTAFFTSALILASSAAVNSFSAKEVGHMAPSSRFASSSKPNVAYLDLNLCALLKKQTTLPSLAYAGIPYQVFGSRPGALALMSAWSRSAMARSGPGISAIFASTSRSPAVNPSDLLSVSMVLVADLCVPFFAGFLSAIPKHLLRAAQRCSWIHDRGHLHWHGCLLPPGERLYPD